MAAQFEVLFECAHPGGALRIEKVEQPFGPAARCSTIFDLQPLAIVGNDREEVRSRPGALAGPKRFEQAKCERCKSKDLQREANPAHGTGRTGTIAPEQNPQGQAQRTPGKP